MRMPSSGGLNQRERTNIDRLVRTSASRTSGERRVPMAHNTGRRNHLLQPRALASGERRRLTSALLSQRSRKGAVGRS
jgi:hypothetical protein